MVRATKRNGDSEARRGDLFVPGDTRRQSAGACTLLWPWETAPERGDSQGHLGAGSLGGWGLAKSREKPIPPSSPELSRATLTSKNPTSSIRCKSQE